MAASLLCRNFGVFRLRTTTTRLPWSRFSGHAEAEPLTLSRQSDGIRYRSAAAMATPAHFSICVGRFPILYMSVHTSRTSRFCLFHRNEEESKH